MWLTVLGSAASYPGPGQACAGYLVEGGHARVLLDCGNGVLSNLAVVVDPLSLDAVFITHGHPDHFVDIYALQALLRYAPEGPADSLPLYLPGGLFERMSCLLSERGAAEFSAAFIARDLSEGEPVAVGGLTITPRRVEHSHETYAFVVTDGEATLCYSSDTSLTPSIVEAARGCDLLLAESTLPEQYAGMAEHLTATEAGVLARDAGAGALVLTHVWPTDGRDQMLAAVAEVFDGPVSVAREYDTYEIVPGSGAERGNAK